MTESPKIDKTITVLPDFLHTMHRYGCWPKTGEEYQPPKRFYMSYPMFIAPMVITIILQLIQIGFIVVNGQQTINELIMDVTDALSMFGCVALGLNFLINVPELAQICGEFSRFKSGLTNPKDQATLTRYNLYDLLFIYYTTFAIVVIASVKLFVDDCTYELGENRRICGLLYNTWLPFRYNQFPVKQLVALFQFWALFYNVKTGPPAAFSILEWAQHICVRIRVFKRNLKDLLDAQPQFDLATWNLKYYAMLQEHCDIIDLNRRLRKCYKNLLFTHFTMTSSIMGMCLFVIVKTHDVGLSAHFIGWLTVLCAACIASQDLINESLDIGTVIYDSKWYYMPVSIQKDLQMMLIATQRPLYLESTSFSYFSFEFFLNMIRASYSYITLLGRLT